MPLKGPESSNRAREAVRSALDDFAGIPEVQLHALKGTRPDELELTAAHQVFNLDLSDLRAGSALAAIRHSGWRYLLRDGDKVVASAETIIIDGAEQFLEFNQGPFVASTAGALKRADKAPETQARSFEPRLLQVPALHTVALWLHSDGEHDLLIPLDPTLAGIVANRVYPAAELLGILTDQARLIPQMGPDDTRGG